MDRPVATNAIQVEGAANSTARVIRPRAAAPPAAASTDPPALAGPRSIVRVLIY